MAGLSKVAGSKLFIGGRVTYKTIVQLSDFSGQTWVEIDGWQQTGDLGVEQEALTQTLINQNTTLYAKGVISFPIMSNVFSPDLADAGQTAFRAAQRSCKPYAFKIEWADDCGDESVVTITQASPAVVTWTAHGLANGTAVTFTTTGTLPAPLVAGNIYFVVTAAANTFQVALTAGGTAIATTAAGTGVHTAQALPVGETDFFYGLAMYGTKTGGDASATRLLNLPIQPIAPFISV
jgi:hypothetical protein